MIGDGQDAVFKILRHLYDEHPAGTGGGKSWRSCRKAHPGSGDETLCGRHFSAQEGPTSACDDRRRPRYQHPLNDVALV